MHIFANRCPNLDIPMGWNSENRPQIGKSDNQKVKLIKF